MVTKKLSCPMPGIHSGILTMEDMQRVNEIMRKYNIPGVKFTRGQGLLFQGLDEKQQADLKKELNIYATLKSDPKKPHSIQVCPGKTWCKFGQMETESINRKLLNLKLAKSLPAKVKIAVSGCANCCCGSWLKDVGLVGENRGWLLIFGGNGGGAPRIGDVIANGLTEDKVVDLIRKTLEYYIETADIKDRTARYMEKTEVNTFKKNIGLI